MASSVAKSWARINAWLRANGLPARFSPPAGVPEAALRAAEAEMGVELPEEVRESYRTHDGTYRRFSVLKLFGRSFLLPLADVVHHRRTMFEIGEDTRAFLSPVATSGPVTSDYWSAGWVPLTTDEECAKFCIDLSPPPGGQPGQVIEWTRDEGNRVVAASWGAWLAGLADGLEAGAYRLCVSYETTAFVWPVSEPDGWEAEAAPGTSPGEARPSNGPQ